MIPYTYTIYQNAKLMQKIKKNDQNQGITNQPLWLRRVSRASKNKGPISGVGDLIAHLSPGTPITAVSSIKNGIPFGILADRYNTSWFPFLRFAMKNMLEEANCSIVASTLFIVIPGISFDTSLESGNDFHVWNKYVYINQQVII